MSLSPGTRLGPYEILAPLGAGGMGEVYKARDTRLERNVAIKVLPAHLTSSAEIRQRFEREAKTISQLSHPHICALYDVGNHEGVEYLVMEYLEGETLSDRLAKGALSLQQTLRYGTEISDALDKAHRHGIVHRDLKPGNVMITTSGVKLLDFGLAKAMAPPTGSQLTSLPTQASPVTQAGTVLGTFQYMAPEQLEGKEADARTDIFALGVVLYEMATGRKAFSGTSQASLISAIMTSEPAPISAVQPLTPSALDRAVKRCLAKDPEERWQSAHDVGLELRWIQHSADEPSTALPGRRSIVRVLPWGIAALSVLAVIALFAGRRHSPKQLVRVSLTPPPNSSFYFLEANNGRVAISPDGRRLAFSALDAEGTVRLWVRPLDAEAAFPIAGTEAAFFPFWSPDGRALGFFAQGKLKTVEASAAAASPRSIANVLEARGGSWADDGTILYSPWGAGGLYRVSARGGEPVPATQLQGEERDHRWPWFLPGGRRFLYEVRYDQAERNAIYVGSLDSKEKRFVLQADSDVVFAPPRFLFYRNADRLMVSAFDPASLRVSGEAIEVARGIQSFPPTSGTIFSATEDLLAFSPQSEARLSRLVWLDRSGIEVGTVSTPANYQGPRLSRDGRRLAVSIIENFARPPDVWLYETNLGTGTRLTHASRVSLMPVFSPDGSRVVFASNRKGAWNLYETDVSNPAGERTLLESSLPKWPCDFKPDGQFLLYREFSSETRGDLKYLPTSGEGKPQNFVATAYDEGCGAFSPDGRWVAYTSDESGQSEVHVTSFPDASRHYRVSSGGGTQPRWSPDGRELFYLSGTKMMSVPVERPADDLTFGSSLVLFERALQTFGGTAFNFSTRYDVSRDGRILALVRANEQPPPPLTLVFNWMEMLKKR
ncbi:MAG TPA: protein kinase [Thermoanaerobaculia bacterium]